jgi:hypothetical protein
MEKNCRGFEGGAIIEISELPLTGKVESFFISKFSQSLFTVIIMAVGTNEQQNPSDVKERTV